VTLKWFGWRHLAVAAVLCMIALDAPVARAAGKGGRVGVVVMRGAGEGPVRAKVTTAIKANGFQVVGAQQLDSTASSLGVSLDSDAGFKAVAKELNISAFVTGEISRKKADLTVRNGADGAALGDASFAGANPKKIAAQVGADFWRQLGPAVRQGKPPSGSKTKAAIAEEAPPAEAEEGGSEPPPPPEPKKKAKRVEKRAEESAEAEPAKGEGEAESKPAKGEAAGKEKEEEEETPSSSFGGAAGPALALGVGGRALFRRLNWHQTPMNNLPPYALSPGPEGTVWLETYPGAFVTKGFAANIGVFANFDQGFGVTSTTTDGAKLTTKFQEFTGGVKVRLPLNNMLAPYASVAYGSQVFKLESSNGATSVVPSVAYRFIRLGLGTRVAFTPAASADIGAAFLLVTDLGKLNGYIAAANYFPHATANALDVGASFSYRIIKLVGARVGVDFLQYGLDFKVRPGETPVAGGATDRFITVWAASR